MRFYPHRDIPPDTPIPAPTLRRPRKGRYADLMALVTEGNGDWVVVTDARTITGRTPRVKATAVHSAAFVSHIKVQTTFQSSYMDITLVGTRPEVAG
jgi:hypothetical protein